MTRNFSNQRRDGMRPSSRNSAFGKYREEQSRPARPRLSRDAVDRAWENGATRTYADYQPRQHPPTPPAQRQGRPAPAYERSRQPQNRRPYDQPGEHYGSPRPSARPGEYQPRQYAENGQRHFDRPGYRAPGGQSGLNSERWTRPQATDSYGPRRADQRAPRFAQDGPNAGYGGANRAPRSQADGPAYRGNGRAPRFQQNTQEYRGNNQGRPFEQNERGREQFARGQRGYGSGARRDNYNPRWQSRPGPQRDFANQQRENPAPWQETQAQYPGQAQFEGDYERFTDYERADTPQPRHQATRPEPAYERPVTRLPNGRVLKGSRPSQRKQARFWNEVEEESSSLISHSPYSEQAENASAPPPQRTPTPRATGPKRGDASEAPRVKRVKTERAEDAKPHSAKVARKNAQGARHKNVSRPSRRGYKWPAAGE